MKKFKNGTATVREYINITIQRIQLAGTHCTTKAINTFAQVYGIVAHYKAVVFIQVEHGFFENKGRNFPEFKKHGGFRMVTMFSGRQTLPLRLFGQSVDSVDGKPDGFKSGTNPCLSRKKHYLCRNPLFIINYSLPT